ncbi:MAG: hypothetical protein Q3971_05030 [Moraxella sp.]|nr:hypothetical protein [Moraxella sp.]
MKKVLLAFLACALIVPMAHANPKTTTLRFAKGSYCTSFTGYYHNRIFKIYLLPKQTLEIRTNDVVEDVLVKDPTGRMLTDVGEENYNYRIRQKGNHTIKINRASINGGSDTIEFCAY